MLVFCTLLLGFLQLFGGRLNDVIMSAYLALLMSIVSTFGMWAHEALTQSTIYMSVKLFSRGENREKEGADFARYPKGVSHHSPNTLESE